MPKGCGKISFKSSRYISRDIRHLSKMTVAAHWRMSSEAAIARLDQVSKQRTTAMVFRLFPNDWPVVPVCVFFKVDNARAHSLNSQYERNPTSCSQYEDVTINQTDFGISAEA